MNPAHLHLLLNHLPLIGIPFSLGFLFQSIRKHNDASRNFALTMLFVSCCFSIPVYLTGEPAEHLLKNIISDLDMSSVHDHEGAGQISLILCVLTAVVSASALYFKKRQIRSSLTFGAIALAIASTCTLAYTSYLGGSIRHTELNR